jgi:pimeloyl-ACP methyl ester carboxylesterase
MTSRFWDRLVPLLDGPVLATDMPGRRGKADEDLATLTVDREVASVLADVEAATVAGELGDPIIVVAHSSGGLTVPGIVAGLGDRVAAIVLNAASVPPEGGCGLDCMQERHADGVRVAIELAAGDVSKLVVLGKPPDPERLRSSYGGAPLDDESLAFVLDPERLVADTMNLYLQPVHWSQVPTSIPITYVINELDRAMPLAKQEAMAALLPGDTAVVRMRAGHVPAITDPEAFAAILRTVADQTRTRSRSG